MGAARPKKPSQGDDDLTCLCVCVYERMLAKVSWYTCKNQRRICEYQFSASTMQVLSSW